MNKKDKYKDKKVVRLGDDGRLHVVIIPAPPRKVVRLGDDGRLHVVEIKVNKK